MVLDGPGGHATGRERIEQAEALFTAIEIPPATHRRVAEGARRVIAVSNTSPYWFW
jgi:hypothetical protein